MRIEKLNFFGIKKNNNIYEFYFIFKIDKNTFGKLVIYSDSYGNIKDIKFDKNIDISHKRNKFVFKELKRVINNVVHNLNKIQFI